MLLSGSGQEVITKYFKKVVTQWLITTFIVMPITEFVDKIATVVTVRYFFCLSL